MQSPIRINKYLADKGLTTRRGADALITAGKVFINGKKAMLGQKVATTDEVEIRNLKQRENSYLLYYKPKGVITHSPGEGETDIVTSLKKMYDIEGVFPIGRLDKSSEGLMILTSDGRVTKRLLDPKMKHEKEYEVRVDKPINGHFLKKLESGVRIEGYQTKPARAGKIGSEKQSFSLVLTEGKKHQIRRMCAALGYQVLGLKRVRVMDQELGGLKPGQIKKLGLPEIQHFLNELGLV